MAFSKKSEKNIISRVVSAVLVSLQAFASAIAVISVVQLQILQERYIWLMVGVMAVLLVLTVSQLIREKSKKATKIICSIIAIMVSAISFVVFYYTNSVNHLLDKISNSDASVVSEKDLTSEPFIAYISGSDARNGLGETARSDVNMVAAINPKTGKILLVSIPRDTYVQLHNTVGLKDKLTHAGLHGVNMSKATIEDFLGIKIDHTIKVSFGAVVGLVNALDGIEIYSDAAMHLELDAQGRVQEYCDYHIGTQKVDGDCALRFSRERKTYGSGDMHRGENQQQVLSAIIAKLSGDKGYLIKLPSILDIIAEHFATSFTRDDITSFIRFQLETGKNWQIDSLMINGKSDMLPTYTYGEEMPLYVMHAYPESVTEAQTKISEYLNNMF